MGLERFERMCSEVLKSTTLTSAEKLAIIAIYADVRNKNPV